MLEMIALGLWSSGAVQLTLVDAHGKPIANRQVWLAPTSSTKPIRAFGDHWWTPTEPPTHAGVTDKQGSVSIKGVAKGKPMAVITKAAPRFDAFVHKESPNSPSMDTIKFDGAVYAGRPAKVVLADDYVISGIVTDRETGRPVPGVKIELDDTLAGHMSGYPLTALDVATTDAQGRYTFSRLPNSSYTLMLRGWTKPGILEARHENGPWHIVLKVDTAGKWLGDYIEGEYARTPQTRHDFRVSRPATLVIRVHRRKAKTMRGWFVRVISLDTQGNGESGTRMLDWSPNPSPKDKPRDDETDTVTVLPGRQQIGLEGEKFERVIKIQTVDVKPGEKRTIDIDFSKVLKIK